MSVNFGKLWAKCVEESISPSRLFREVNLSTQTFFEMRNNRTVSLKTIDKICTYFKCQPDEIMEFDFEKSNSDFKN